jgi:tetratricopeptide (TPR) repeat protein
MASVVTTQPPARRLPRVWGDVPPRNPNFTGREEILAKLHGALMISREAAVLPQALHGMGGVGKSQLAIEYVHRHSVDYDLVWWISAEQNTQVLSSLIRLAQQLGLDVSPEANSAVPAVQDALNTGRIEYERWLLVFDNAESLTEVLPYFPTGGAGKVLVTSRNPEWAGVARTLEVDVFTRDESKAFLKNRTPELSDPDADRLADALGDLPLAVEQAAAWHATTGMPVDQYLELLNQKRIELLDEVSPVYQRSVAAAWNVSLDRLDQDNRAALQLLQVCSFFSPEPISREFFATSTAAAITDPLDTALRDPIKLSRAIRDIQRYALAKFNHQTNTLQIHRLIQAVLVGRMDREQADLIRAGAHALLAAANPGGPGRSARWGSYEALLPHVRASGAVRSIEPNVMRLVYDTIQFLFHWGDHTGALTLAEEAYKNWLGQLGEEHPQTLRLAKYLAYLRAQVGQYGSAVKLFRRVLDLYTEQSGEDDEETLDAMLLVAYGYRITGEFERARDLDERAYRICHRLFGEDDPVTLRAAHNLGISLRLVGQFSAAAELDEKTYLRRMDVLGPSDAETLRTLNHLIIDQRESGNFVDACAKQEECRDSVQIAFSFPDNPNVLFASRNLAVARRRAGDHSGALTLSEETAERYRRRYGDTHPDTISADLNSAIDRRHAGDLDGADRLGRDTLRRYRDRLGDDHPHTLSAQVNLAVVTRQKGDAKGAFLQNKLTLARLSERLGSDHPITLTCATNLASDLFALGDAQSAFDLDTDTLARSERVLGVQHPSTLAVGVNLALDLRALEREQEASLLQADNMARFRRSLGEHHPATLNALRSSRADCDVDPMPL